MLEIELKFRIDDPEKIAKKLRGMGAMLASSGFERNIIWDRRGELKKSGLLLRLRSYGSHADITTKKKMPSVRFKVRKEIVVNIENFEKGKELLESLGYSKVWVYEKKRQTWEMNGVGVNIDEVPIGNFVEIEGSEEKIVDTAKKLGLDMKESIPKSYMKLYIEYCEEKGLPTSDMVFSGGKK